MENILICTIMRDAEKYLQSYFGCLKGLSDIIGGKCNLEFSIYENDSKDNTKNILRQLPKEEFVVITTENLGTQSYSSTAEVQRMYNLAAARRKAIDAVDINRFDKVAFIEADVVYDPNWAQELILQNHIKADIYSGWSLRSMSNPKESMYLYDTFACRQYENQIEWDHENERKWLNASLIPTRLSHIDSNCVHSLRSTFSCFCVYNAQPFKEGVRWSAINPYLVKNPLAKQPIGGNIDADTVNICEEFRLRGYDKIYTNRNCIIRHL